MPPIALLIAFDLLGFVCMAFELAVPSAFAVLAGRACFAAWGWTGALLLSPLLLGGTLVSFCLGVFVLRLFAPRVREGEFPFPNHAVSRAWAIQLQVARLAQMTGVRPFFMGTNLLRFLYLRALGARNAFRINTSSDLYVYDASMVEIGEGVMIGGTSGVVGHFIDSGKLTLLRTVIGRDCQLLTGVLLGPGTRLGERVTFGSFSRTAANVRIGDRCHLGYSVTIEPNVIIGSRVIVGNRAVIQSQCEIGDRAFIAPGAVVPKGTKLAAGERFGEAPSALPP